MNLSSTRWSLGLLLWGIVLTGTLSIATLPGHWGADICGPWGCGPPLQALVAWHLSWLVLAVPLSIIGGLRLAPRPRRIISGTLCLLTIGGVCAVAAREYLVWYPTVTAHQQPYLLQRIGFSIVTRVEVPILAALPCGLIVQVAAACRMIRLGANREGRFPPANVVDQRPLATGSACHHREP